MGEKLEVPVFALKRLVNHSVSNDMTGRYLVLDIDRIRIHMSRITNEFVKLFGINDSDMKPWQRHGESSFDPTEFTQMQIPLNNFPTEEMQPNNSDLLTSNVPTKTESDLVVRNGAF